MMVRPAVFLDRDGTINVEVNYLHRVADVRLIEGVAPAIAKLNHAGLPVIVVTNQAGIARGYYGTAEVDTVHTHLSSLLQLSGAHIDGWYYCPHHPDFTAPCNCRKPRPGMLLQAAADHDIDLRRSWMIGDTESDMGAGRAADCRSILVRTGYGARTAGCIDTTTLCAVVADLPAAVEELLRTTGPNVLRG